MHTSRRAYAVAGALAWGACLVLFLAHPDTVGLVLMLAVSALQVAALLERRAEHRRRPL